MTVANTERRSVNGAVVWGTYDLGKPRTRLLLKALATQFHIRAEIHASLWHGIEDKSQLKGAPTKLKLIARWLLLYPKLIYRYLRAPRHRYVMLPYMAYVDLLVLLPFARLRGATICVDIFISLYDTVVIDRQLLKRRSIAAKLLYAFEWLVLRLADTYLLDTQTHARYIENLFNLPPEHIKVVWVGAEQDIFTKLAAPSPTTATQVLFFGQFIPLHGLDVIIDAAAILAQRQANVDLVIVGKGQLQADIDAQIHDRALANIRRISWVAYEQLNQLIAQADICLGIFAPEGKALRVVPNKVYQVLAAQKPLISADTPAIREVITESPWITLVPPGNAEALADAIGVMAHTVKASPPPSDVFPHIELADIAKQLKNAMQPPPRD